jgi:hypothetical protein
MKSKLQKNSDKYITQQEFSKRNYRLERDSKESASYAYLHLRAERR